MASGVANGIVVTPESLGVRVRKAIRTLRRMPIVPAVILLALVVSGITAPWISPEDPVNGDLNDNFLPPVWQGAESIPKTVVEGEVTGYRRLLEIQIGSPQFEEAVAARGLSAEEIEVGDELLVEGDKAGSTRFFFGTDELGRDILSRIFHGARISLIVAAITLGVGGTIGTFAGLVSGYYGGWVDELIMRLVDIVLSIPILLVTLVLVASLGASFELIVGVLSLILWPLFARVTRGEVLQLKNMDYVALARISGASSHAHNGLSPLAGGIQYVDSHRHAERGRGYPGGSFVELPGGRGPAANAGLGFHGGRRPGPPGYRLVDCHHARTCHRPYRNIPEPLRRLVEGYPRPKAPPAELVDPLRIGAQGHVGQGVE